MLKTLLRITKVRDVAAGIKTKRSPHWSGVQRKFLEENSICSVCGGSEHLNVHHKKPFHLFPELELDSTNLITLCMKKETLCHLAIGHGDNFKAYNPNIEPDVERLQEDLNLLNEVAQKAKEARLLA